MAHPLIKEVVRMHKRPISFPKLRTVPKQFSWVDQRLVRERYIHELSHEACALSLFLVTVGDAHGLSYYADLSLCQRLSLTSLALHQARQALIAGAWSPINARSTRSYLDAVPHEAPARASGVTADDAHGPQGRVRTYLGVVGMIDYHRFCQIKQRLHYHQGLNASQIAQEVALDRRMVTYWLTEKHFRPRKPRPHASKLDPFKPEITGCWNGIPIRRRRSSSACTSTALMAAIAGQSLCAHGAPQAPARVPQIGLCPGECAQVDWGMLALSPWDKRTGS